MRIFFPYFVSVNIDMNFHHNQQFATWIRLPWYEHRVRFNICWGRCSTHELNQNETPSMSRYVSKYCIWLVLWNIILFSHILGMSSSQLTNSYFSEGWPWPTNQCFRMISARRLLVKAKTNCDIVRSSEVPVVWNIPAYPGPVGLGSRLGNTVLSIDSARTIPKFAQLSFGDAAIELVGQDREEKKKSAFGWHFASWRYIDSQICGCHCQWNCTGVFWILGTDVAPRCKERSVLSNDAWMSFEDILNDACFPEIPIIEYPVIPCPWHRCMAWYHSKTAKSEGCWTLRMRIFSAVLSTGLGPGMMMAKAVLLSKVQTPSSMHHDGPITILSCLYRLFGKFIFRITANIWKKSFPNWGLWRMTRTGCQGIGLHPEDVDVKSC